MSTRRNEQETPGRIEATRFEVIREVGKGGMATIYLAKDALAPHRPVALKVIHPHLAGDPDLVARFQHEVRAQVQLKHPCVVEMIGWGEDATGRLFMAMEYVDGPTLRDLMQAARRLPVELASYVTASVLAGLGCAHDRGLVHRDVKPGNIMVTRDGRVKVADFGIAKAEEMTKLTSTGNVIGTPAYMSPEQALARPLDARSDLFSVGVMLYEMLLGENPFQTGNPATTLSRVVHHQQRPAFETLPTTPALLEGLLDSLLQKDAERRPESASHALKELARAVAEDGQAATPELMTRFLARPDEVAGELNTARARRHFERGVRVFDQGRGSAEAALWELFLATLLDPGNGEAQAWLEQVSSERGYTLQRKASPKIEELEQKLAQEPDNLNLVLALAKLHKAQGNFLQVIFYYKRARALKPSDPYTKNQLTTLVGASAAPVIDGTGMFLSPVESATPSRRERPVAAEPRRAEGWGDFVSGILSTSWAKVGIAAALLAAVVLGIGGFIDHQVVASARAGRPGAHPPTGDPAVDRYAEQLSRAQGHSNRKKHEEAEEIYRTMLEEQAGTEHESQVLYLLGECLERQGKRTQAMNVHGDNVARHSDDWAARSRGQRAQLYVVEHDLASARSEYQAMADMTTGERRLQAQVAMADLTRQEGRRSAAIAEYEELLPKLPAGSDVRDEARLALASLREETGDAAGAAVLYEEIRSTTDHRSGAFRAATQGLNRTAPQAEEPGGGEASSWSPETSEAESTGSDALVSAGALDDAQELAAGASEESPYAADPVETAAADE